MISESEQQNNKEHNDTEINDFSLGFINDDDPNKNFIEDGNMDDYSRDINTNGVLGREKRNRWKLKWMEIEKRSVDLHAFGFKWNRKEIGTRLNLVRIKNNRDRWRIGERINIKNRENLQGIDEALLRSMEASS